MDKNMITVGDILRATQQRWEEAQQDFMELYDATLVAFYETTQKTVHDTLGDAVTKAQQSVLYNEDITMTKPDLLKAENEVRKEIKALNKQLDDYLVTDEGFWIRTSHTLLNLAAKAIDIGMRKRKEESHD